MKKSITKMNRRLVIGLIAVLTLFGSGKAWAQDVTLVANTSSGATGLYGLSTGVSVTSGTGNSLVTISREATTINQKNQTPTAGCFGTSKVYLISSASGGQIKISLPNTGDYYLDKVELLLSSNASGATLSGAGANGHYKWVQADGTTYSSDNGIGGLTGYDQYTTICASPITATAVTGAKAMIFGRGTIGGTSVSGAEFRIWQIRVWIKQVISCSITPSIFSVGGGGTICNGSSTNVILANSESGVTYQLYKNAVASGSTVPGTGSALSWPVSTAGTYTVQTPAVGSYCATTMSNNAVVVVNQPPTTSINGGDQSIVDGGTTSVLGGITPSIGSGAWSITSGGTGTFSNYQSGSSTFTPTGGVGDYVLTWTISNSPCTESTSSLTVHVASNSSPVINWTSGTTSQNVSAGSSIGNIVYTWAGSANAATVTWTGTSSSSTPPTGVSVSDNSGSGPVTISGTPTVAGTYDYSITSSDGTNTSVALTGALTVKLATPDVSAGATTPTNQGFTAQWAAVSGVTSYTVKVYLSGVEVGAAQQTGITGTSIVISGLSANTTYTYKITAIGTGAVPNSDESVASAGVRTLNTAKAITAFSITGQVSSTINGTNISVVMPYETVVTNLTPSITHSGVSISLTGVQDFTDPKDYTITAEDGSTQTYTATVTFGSLSTDNFRSKADGDWNDATPGNVWESQTNGTWYPATLIPGISAASITIKSPNSVSVATNTTIGTTTIESGATLKTTGTAIITVGASKTLNVNGIFENNGSVSDLVFSSATAVNFNSGSTYLLSGTSSFIPGGTTIISWNANSNIDITGGFTNGTLTTVAGTTYGNITFDTSTPTGNVILFGSGNPMQKIAGNLTVTNIGAGSLQLISSSATNIFAIDGNYTQTSGIVTLNPSSYAATTFRPCVVKGDFTLNGGSFSISTNTANCYLIVEGNFAINNSAVFQNTGTTSATGAAYVHLAGANSTFTRSATSAITASSGNKINFIVNSGSVVNVGDCVIDGGSNVTFTTSGAYTAPAIVGTTVTTTTSQANHILAITNGANLAGIQPGMAISGAGIPADTYVTAVYAADKLQISKGTTAAASGVTFTVTPASATASNLNVAAGKKLTISTALTNNGILNLLSDATGTTTILTPSTISGSGIANVNQYLTYRTWYMSSPVASATPSGMGVIKYFDETVAGNTWTPTTTMTAGKGYFVTPIDDEDHISNILFSGSLNSGNQDITLTRTLANTEKPGFNLIGNPYPSYLDWTAVCSYSTDGGTTHPNQDIMPTTTMWYRTKASGTWDFVTVNGEGVKSPSEATATKYIPPMQAFWVRAKNTGTSTLKLTDAMCSHAGTAENPSPNALKAPAASQSALQILRLQVSNGTNTDETVIYFSANASNDMDKIDAPKMSNENATIPEIYTTLGTERIVINAMHSIPLDQPIGLGFVPGSAASFSIKANEVSNLPADVKVILKDNVTLAETDLTDGTAVYQFSPETTSADRFSVIFRSSSTTTGLNNNNVNGSSVYWNNNQGLTFRTNDDKLVGGNISVYNAIGQKLLSKKITGTSMNIDFNYTPDVYIVKVNNVTAKVIVK